MSRASSLRTAPLVLTDNEELARVCGEWTSRPVLGLDTEFVRTRTFYARLGLIQVYDGRRVVLVDTVVVDDLSPLQALLRHRSMDVVFHSCHEDMAIFAHLFGVLPQRIFDTQIAAALVGYGFSQGYQGLVERVLDVRLAKDETRSDWMARPPRRLAAALTGSGKSSGRL